MLAPAPSPSGVAPRELGMLPPQALLPPPVLVPVECVWAAAFVASTGPIARRHSSSYTQRQGPHVPHWCVGSVRRHSSAPSFARASWSRDTD
jgi:hypothetical protein